jgi:hypothetical protein
MTVEAGHAPNRAYFGQDGCLHLNGADLFDSAERPRPQSVAFTITPSQSGSDATEITVQVTDGAGNAIAGVFHLDVWLADAAAGVLSHTAPSDSFAVLAPIAGVDLIFGDLGNLVRVMTTAAGTYTLRIQDGSHGTWFVCAQVPGTGKTVASRQLTAADYSS